MRRKHAPPEAVNAHTFTGAPSGRDSLKGSRIKRYSLSMQEEQLKIKSAIESAMPPQIGESNA